MSWFSRESKPTEGDNSYGPKGQGNIEQGGTGKLAPDIEAARRALEGAPQVRDNKIGGQPVTNSRPGANG